MGIYKKGRIWWFIKQYKGKRVEGSLETKNKQLAEQKFARILSQIMDGSHFEHPQEVPKMRTVIERYQTEVSQLQASHERNVDYARHWCDFFGDCLVSEATKSRLSTYKAKRLSGEIIYGKGKGRKAGESTVKKELSYLRRVFNKAIDEWDDDWNGYFRKNTANPARTAIKGLREMQRVRYVTPEEAQRLRFTLPKWIKPMAVVSAHTGLRLGNIVNLLVHYVDFGRNCINLPAERMKNRKPMSIMMTSEVRSTLERVIRESTSSAFVFSDENGNPYTSNAVSMAFRRACRRAKIKDLRFHDLRHDFATLLANEGASLYQIQMMLGHSDPRMTQRYAHLLPENLNVVKYIDGKGITTILRQSDKKKRGYNA